MTPISLITALLWTSYHPTVVTIYKQGPAPIDERAAVHHLTIDESGPLVIEVEQITADVKVTAYVDQSLVARPVTAPGHAELHEVIFLSNARAGALEIRIELATPGSPPGQYMLRVGRPAEGSPESRALQIQAEAALAYSDGKARKKSIELYLQAAESWLTANEWERSIECQAGAAIVAYHLGKKKAALKILPRLINELEHRTHPLLATMLVYLGRVEFQRGERERAENLLRRALELQSGRERHHDRASTLNNLALMLHVSGKLDQAASLYEESLALFRAANNRTESATLLNNLGGVHYMRGELGQAIDYFQQALAVHEAIGNKSGQADALGNIGLTQRLMGNYVNFVTTMIDVLRLREELNDPVGIARAKHRLGAAYMAIGTHQRAIAMLEESKTIRTRMEENRTLAATLRELGRAYAYSGDPKLALQNLAEASALSSRAGERGAAAEAQLISAQVLAGTLGDNPAIDLEGAWKAAQEAMELLAETEDRVRFGRGNLTLGKIALASGRTSAAVDSLNKSVELLEAFDDRLGLVEAYSKLAGAKLTQQIPGDALSLSRKAGALITGQRGQIANPILRAAYQSSVRDVYDVLIDLILANDTEAASREAFAIAESLKAKSLRELLDTRLIDSPDNNERKNLIERLTALSALREQALADEEHHRSVELDALINEVFVGLDELDERDRPTRALAPERDLARRLQREISSNEALVSFHMGENRSGAWILTRDRFLHRNLPEREVLKTLVVNALQELDYRRSRRTVHTAALSEALLWPLADELDVERILFVPDDFLFLVPYAALSLPNTGLRLIQRQEVAILQSAYLLSTPIDRPETSRVLLVGDPVFDRTDPRVTFDERVAGTDREQPMLRSAVSTRRLPHTQREVTDIRAMIGPQRAEILLGLQATKTNILQRPLTEYEILHFATHAAVNDDYAELSGLLFSAVDIDGRSTDQLLPVIEILGLSLSARLVVLSACDTAGGHELRGEGILSLSYAFVAAGATSVIATLWPIEDYSASRLMRSFYRDYSDLDGNSLRALRQAQLAMLEDPRTRHPSLWAGFVHYGTGHGSADPTKRLDERFP